MDAATVELAESLVTPRYVQAGAESLRHFQGVLRSLVAHRRCPEEGLPECAIEQLMHQLALMDSNNFAGHVGGGEREGRVVCDLVRRRHYNLTHGIGRSGDLTADQPKAAGSSLLYQLTNALVLNLICLAGTPSTQAALVVPMATGMTLALALRSVAKQREVEEASAATQQGPPRYVLWLRIDQKTALKCIEAAGFVPYPVELAPAPSRARRHAPPRRHEKTVRDGNEGTSGGDDTTTASAASAAVPVAHADAPHHPYFICSRVEHLEEAMAQLGGRARVLCVLSTTSCFAPRLPDDTLAIARFCRAQNIAHVVNNAYGVQSRVIMSRLDAAQRHGRVDFVVQSGDKNFLVPVGGAVLTSPDRRTLQAAAALYAGRASATPAIDLFMTCLSLGRQGMLKLWRDRYIVRAHLERCLCHFASARGEVLLCEDDADNSTNESGPTDATPSPSSSSSPPPPPCTSDGFPETKSLPRNDISFAITMHHYGSPTPRASAESPATAATDTSSDPFAAARAFGAKLFRSAVTGPRVVCPAPDVITTIARCSFRSYGVHQDAPPYACPLLVVACGIGMSKDEVDALMTKLAGLWPVAAGANTMPR